MKKLILIALALTLTLTGVRCTKGPTAAEIKASQPVTIRWWRVFDDQKSVQPIIDAYRVKHPNVTIEYRKIRTDEYEQELVNALAEDRGPDIISLHNTWIREYLPKLAPLPPTLNIPFTELTGSIKKEMTTTIRTVPTLSTRALKEKFLDTVVGDVLIPAKTGELIFGLPLSLDTLALYVNKDILNLAGIPEVPQTWGEMQLAVKKLTKFDSKGNLIQSGAALGDSKNIDRSVDILSLLMMQNGAEMMDSNGRASFDKIPASFQGRGVPPGEEALVFYTDFANPQKETYTWPATETNSLESFAAGRTAMMFGYSYHLPLIKARAPRLLNLTIAKAPQIEGNPEVNLANYWIEAVSRKSSNQNWAWDFLQFATSADQVSTYLKTTLKPTALRGLVASQLENESLNAFASQLLTAKSWYKGTDSSSAEQALLEAVDAVLAGVSSSDAVKTAAQKVNQTLK